MTHMNISLYICAVIAHKHHVLRQNESDFFSFFLKFIAASNFTVAHVVLLDSGGDNKSN